jgi:type VI secretion system protein
MLLALLAVVIPLAACSTPSWLCYFPGGVKKVTLVTAPDTNRDRAIAVDLVYVTGTLAAQQIGKLSAREFFSRRTQLLRDYPDTVMIRSWEVAPGQLVKNAATKPPCNLVATYLFADYATPGDHRATLGGVHAVQVTLGAADLSISP